MKSIYTFLVFIVISSSFSFGQILIPGERIMDVIIGADWDEVEWELGFKGFKIEKENASLELNHIAKEAGIDYDFIVNYQHIMWLPVSDLFFRDNKVCLIQLSSYPEYNMMLCADIGTLEGLNFWDDPKKAREIYSDMKESTNENKVYFVSKDKGLGVEMLNDEARTMFIFQPQME